MKKKWFRAMELADEQYIAEADPQRDKKSGARKRILISVLASCACFALVLCNVWLFAPYNTVPPSAEHYADDRYYPVIEKLSALTWEKPKYENNFDMLINEVPRDFLASAKGDAMQENAAPGDAGGVYDGVLDGSFDSMGSMEEESAYQEVTDNQVAGITEADRIKRSDKHIYYLDGSTLRIFSIEGLASKELNRIPLLGGTKEHYVNQWEFYLSSDCKTATVIVLYTNGQKQRQVGVICLDVSDPHKITEKNRLEITGNYLSSRMTDGKLLLLTEFVFNKNDMDFDKESTFLPQINGKSIAAEDIIVPEEVNSTRYTIVLKLDENTLAIEGQAAFLSYSEDVYVSHDHIFLTNVFADVQKKDQGDVRNAMTTISCLSYKDTFEKKGAVTVRGYVKDQWSMDVYEGILRVVTTTNATTVSERYSGSSVSADVLVTATGNSNASLYCIDLQSFQVVASVEDFAPPREEVQSVRFDKNTAYVCTSIEMSDPVFFFDLSDLNNITYKDTGTIDGFSTSLVDFGDGYLLGIGQENWSTFKVEIYRETENGVEGFCKYTLQNVQYSTKYKSYYIDRENRLLGLGISAHGEKPSNGYLVLHFDGYELCDVVNVELAGENSNKRGVYVDGFMYMFGAEDFKVEKVF